MTLSNAEISEKFNKLADLLGMAKEMGLKVVISTDAHQTGHLDYMRLAINQARRGWLEKEDVLNSRGLDELKKRLKRT